MLIISIISSVPYFFTLNYPFQYDDVPTIFEAKGMSNIDDLANIRLSERPIRKISLIIDRFLFKDNVFFYRMENTILYILCLILAGIFIEMITGSLYFALFSILIFGLHPIHTSSLLVVTHRKEMYLFIFSLLTMIMHIKRHHIPAVICFVLAVLSKETAIVLPVIIYIYDRVFDDRRSIKYYAVYAVILLTGIIMLYINKGGFYLPWTSGNMAEFLKSNRLFRDIQYYHLIIIQPYLFITYIIKLILPINLSIDYYVPVEKGFTLITLIMSFLSLAYIYCIYMFRKNKIIVFSMLSFLLAYIPVSNLIPVLNILSDRYMFFPSLFFILMFYSVYSRVQWRKLLYIMPLLYLVLLIIYIPVFRTERTLWEYTVKLNPKSIVGNNNLGLVHYIDGDMQDAKKYYQAALSEDDEYVNAIINMGTLYASSGDLTKAEELFKRASELETYNIKALYNLGLIYMRQRKFHEAGEMMERVIEISPTSGLAWNNLGAMHYRDAVSAEILFNLSMTMSIYPMSAVFLDEAIETYFIADSIFRRGIALSGESELLINNLNRVGNKFKRGKAPLK